MRTSFILCLSLLVLCGEIVPRSLKAQKSAALPAPPNANQNGKTFTAFVDTRRGFALWTSEPAAGLMDEIVYRTDDGEQKWRTIASSRLRRAGSPAGGGCYPTGITFRNARMGRITATYHADYTPLFRTNDGGRHWTLQTLKAPPAYGDAIADTYPPKFFGAKRREGILPVSFHADSGSRRKGYIKQRGVYITHDGGLTWRYREKK